MVEAAADQHSQRPAWWIRIAGPSEGRPQAFALSSTAAALILVGSFLNFLNHNYYPVGSSEAVLALTGMLAASMLLGISAAALRVYGRIIIPALLVALAIDINSDALWVPLLGLVAAMLFSRFSRQAVILIFGVVTVTQVWIAIAGGSGRSLAAASPALTAPGEADFALVHLILDEHIGLDGIPDSLPRGPEMREQLRKFYVGHGFRIFSGAYSEHLHTVYAVPWALSLGNPDDWKRARQSGTSLESNPYFDALQALGFRIDVVQSDWIDHCNHRAVDTCTTWGTGSLIDVGDRLPTADKAALLLYRFAALSRFAVSALNIYDVVALNARRSGFDMPLVQILRRTNTSTLNGMAAFDEAIESSRSLLPGRAIFAHILLPHFPYAYDDRCAIRPVRDWLGKRSTAPWEVRYAAYFDQVTCATRKVEELLAAVALSPAAGKTVFIIHSDHGSRIMQVEPRIENEGKFSEEDLVNGYSALFTVATPGIEPGCDIGRYPLRLLLDALVRSRFQALEPSLPAGFVPTVAIDDRTWNPVKEWPVVGVDWWNVSGTPTPESQ